MSTLCPHESSLTPSLEVYFLGKIDYARGAQWQQRLVAEANYRDDGRMTLLLCEHPPIITVGREGRPWEIASWTRPIRGRQLRIEWTSRGGGCLVHCPGQLAIYPIIPLRHHGLTVGDYLDLLLAATAETLQDLNISCRIDPRRTGLSGRTGQLASVGVGVRHGITHHGLFLNVAPPLGLMRLIESGTEDQRGMSSLEAERQGHIKMTAVRSSLATRLAEKLAVERCHFHTGRPF